MNRVLISRLIMSIALAATCLGASTGLATTAGATTAEAITGGAKTGATTAQAAAACSAEIPEVGSLDPGSGPDLAVGLPITGEPSDIEVRYGSRPTRRIADPDYSANSFTTFGDSLTSIDVNHDGCSELIVGSYFGSKVRILKGGPTGVSTTGMQTITAPGTDAGFGAVLASARGTGAGDTVDLWVGAPDTVVNGVLNAGAVEHYVLTTGGTITLAQTLTAASLGGTPHAFAHFGAALSARTGTVAIGAPDDTVSGKREAGSAWVVTLNSDGTISGKQWSQATAGVPGTPEANDNFGASVAWGGGTLGVGAPREDVGKAKNTGSVTFIPPTGPVTVITQNSPGVPGNNETGDWFGASLVAGTWLTCQEEIEFAVGSPYEDVGSVKNAGMVTLLPTKDCKGVGLVQGKHGGLGGTPETRDHVGLALSILRGRDDFDEDVQDSLVIGVPGESVGSKTDAGLAYVRRGNRLTSYSGTTAGREFGGHLTVPGAGPMFSS